jgi:hypothetical protein
MYMITMIWPRRPPTLPPLLDNRTVTIVPAAWPRCHFSGTTGIWRSREENGVKIRTAIMGFLILSAASLSPAEVLDGRTLDAWKDYMFQARSRMAARVQAQNQFLWVDEMPDLRSQVRNGQIVVAPVGSGHPRRVPSGLIHDWLGAAFLPNATLEETIRVVTDYSRYKEFYHPLIVESTPLGSDGRNYKFSLVIVNKKLFSETALHSECDDAYFQLDDKRWYSVGYCDSIREIENHGKTVEQELPPNEGTGYIWRLASFSRFEERDGGVYAEREVIALSRDLPGGLRWFIEPIVTRLSRRSLSASLLQTRQAVLSWGAANRLRDTGQTVSLHKAAALPSGQD